MRRSGILIASFMLVVSACDRPGGQAQNANQGDARIRAAVEEYAGAPVTDVLRTVERSGETISLVTTSEGYFVVLLGGTDGDLQVLEVAPGIDAPTPSAGSRAYLLTALTLPDGEVAIGGVVDPDIDRVVAISADGATTSETTLIQENSILTLFPSGGEIRLFEGECLAFAGSVPTRGVSSTAKLPVDVAATAGTFLSAVQEGDMERARRVAAYPEAMLGERLADSLDQVGATDWLHGEQVVTDYSVDFVTGVGRLGIVAANVGGDTGAVGYTLTQVCGDARA